MVRASTVWQLASLGLLLLLPRLAWAQGDYSPTNRDWNGLSSFVEQGRSLGLDIDVRNDLDYSVIGRDTSLLIIYPTVELERFALVQHLRSGGRMLIADDFGTSADLLQRLGVERDESPVTGGIHFRDEPHLPVAAPISEAHVLTTGVRRLMTNHPATFDTSLPAVFVTGAPERTIVAVGAIGEGRIVIVGDPSILINNMLEVRGNRQFARNLLTYLGNTDDGPQQLVLVSGRFGQQHGGASVAGTAGHARRQLNIRLARLSDWAAGLRAVNPQDDPPPWLIVFALLGGAALLAFVISQLRPRPRLYSGRWLRPLSEEPSAGFVGTLEYLKHPKATHHYPLMILKRVLEERLLDGMNLEAPARLGIVMEHYARYEKNPKRQQELENLLVRLSMLSGTSPQESPLKVSARELRRNFELARKLLKPIGRDIEET